MKLSITGFRKNALSAACRLRNNKGFTLMEMMIVTVILGILSTLSVYSTARMIKRAEEARLMAMTHNVNYNVYSHVLDYDLQHRWTSKSYNIKYLNGKLETILENKPYDNFYNHRNPYSKSKVILNYSSIPSKLKNPAVYITNAKKYAYDRIKVTAINKDLRGSVVVYMTNGTEAVDIFYIDIAGYKSKINMTIGKKP